MTKEKNISENENFSKKYTNTNFISRRLVDNFYFKIKELLESTNPQNLLEVACGAGFSTQYLINFLKTQKIEASDISLNLIKEAKIKNPKIKIKRESLYNLKRPDESFDMVVALEVLEHLESPEKALCEIKRVTRKYCLISVPREPVWRFLNMTRGAYWKNLGNTPGHINHWSKRSFIDLISNYFEIKDIKTPLPWIIILAKK